MPKPEKSCYSLYQVVQYKVCALILKTTAFLVDQLCIVPFGPLFLRFPWEGAGDQAGGVEPTHSHTEIFIFAAISRATDDQFFNVFISLDLSFH